MGQVVTTGGLLMCSFGVAPTPLMVLPANKVMINGKPAATIMDHKPFMNIMPFGLCSSMANPAVSAGLGIPKPCTPMTAAPWAPGSPTVMIGNMPTLNNASKLICSFGGIISITMPGQVTTMVP